mmetsp:Transcript_10982/g.22392  ORF Transcript_10982/g.22392 Transcript_10982/m.22392 type:complete len:494 (+) Transcript_10982:177-1658(+)
MARHGRTFSDGGGSVDTGYTNMTGATGVTGTSRTGVTTGPGGFVRLNRLVLFWTVAMTLTVLTILSYFTMAIISIGSRSVGGGSEGDDYAEDGDGDGDNYAEDGDDYNEERRYRILEDAADGDDAANAYDDAYQGDDGAGGDDQVQGDDDAAAAAQYDDQWGADNYDIGDDDQAYGVVDDMIATDDDAFGSGGRFVWGGGMDDFSFVLNWQEVVYLLMIVVAVIGLDYYGLEALKEMGNKAARFRIGAFAAFVLFLGNVTAACAFLLGVIKDGTISGGGIEGTPINCVSVLFVVLSCLYLGFALVLYWSERTPLVSSTKREPLLEESRRSTTNNLFICWILLIVVVTSLLLCALCLDRAAQNAAEHQSHFKLNTALLWSAIAFLVICFVGTMALKARGYSTKLLTGTFFGGLAGYSALCLTFAIYFINASKHKDYEGRITTGETAFAFISLGISVLCAAFSNAVFAHRHAIIKVNAADSGLPTAIPSPAGTLT